MRTVLQLGPGLKQILVAQGLADEVVRHPQLEGYADALVALSHELGHPTVWPVGSSAEQLAGAANLLSCGGVRVLASDCDLEGERVLVLTVTALTPLPLLVAAGRAKLLGAVEIYGCGVQVAGLDQAAGDILLGYFPLLATPAAARQRRRVQRVLTASIPAAR